MRLIDADELKKDLKGRPIELTMSRLIDIQPIAYDINKAVEELEEKKRFCKEEWEKCNEYYRGRYSSLVDAIEIVKKGLKEQKK